LLHTEVEGLKTELKTNFVKLEQFTKQQEMAEQRAEKNQALTVHPNFNVDSLNQLIDQRMQQIIKFDKPTVFTQVDVSGRFKEIIRERFVRELGLKIKTLPLKMIHTAMVVHEKKGVKRGELYSFINGGNSRISDNFYSELQTLEETRLIVYSKDTGIVHWALGEYLKRELSSMYEESTIKQAEDYLASLLLPSS